MREVSVVSFQDLDLDEITEWPLLPQLLVIVLLILVLQGIGAWFYLMPKNDQLQLLKQQEPLLKTTLKIKASKAATLPYLQAQLDELALRYDFLLRQLPVQQELASMLAAVSNPN